MNPERKALYQLRWHLGGSQGDIAKLRGEDVDWQNQTVSFTRQKTGVSPKTCLLHVSCDQTAHGFTSGRLPKKRWPDIKFKEKRAITQTEHLAIVESEPNPKRKAFYKLAWQIGASQSDIAFLEAENIDWENSVISFTRMKTGSIVIMRVDEEVTDILRSLPASGPLFL